MGDCFITRRGGGSSEVFGEITRDVNLIESVSSNDAITNIKAPLIPDESSATYESLTNSAYNVSYSPNGGYLVCLLKSSPWIAIYKITNDTYTQIANPSFAQQARQGGTTMAWTPDSQYLVVMLQASPWFVLYKRTGDIFARITNPGFTLNSDSNVCCSFSSDGRYLLTGGFELNAHKRTGDAFVTAYLGSANKSGANTCAISPDNSTIVFNELLEYEDIGMVGASHVFYKDSNEQFVRGANLNLYLSAITHFVWTQDSKYLIAKTYEPSDFYNYIEIYEKSNNVLTRTNEMYASDSFSAMGFTSNDEYLMCGQTNAQNILAYRFYKGNLINPVYVPTPSWGGLFNISFNNNHIAFAYSGISSRPVDWMRLECKSPWYNQKSLSTSNLNSTFNSMKISPDDKYLVIASSSGGAAIFRKENDGYVFHKTLRSSSFGYSSNDINFTPDGRLLVEVYSNNLYVYSVDNGNFASIGQVEDALSGNGIHGEASSVSPDGQLLAVCSGQSPYLNIFKITSNQLRKTSAFTTSPGASPMGCSWSPNGSYLCVVSNSSPHITIYKRVGDMLTIATQSTALLNTAGTCCSWSPDGRYLVIGHGASPYVNILEQVGDSFTKLTAPVTVPARPITSIRFSKDSKYLLACVSGAASNDKPLVYKISNGVFTSLVTPGKISSQAYLKLEITNNDNLVIYSRTSSPYLDCRELSKEAIKSNELLPAIQTGYVSATGDAGVMTSAKLTHY